MITKLLIPVESVACLVEEKFLQVKLNLVFLEMERNYHNLQWQECLKMVILEVVIIVIKLL